MMNTEWVNIPASYLLAAYLCAACALAWAHPRRRTWRRLLLAAFALALVFAVTLLPNPNATGLQFLLCMSAVWIGLLCFLRASLDVPWVEAAYASVRTFFLGDLAASLMWQLAHYLLSREIVRGKLAVSAFVALPCLALYVCAVWLAERQLNRSAEGLQIRKKDLATVLLTGTLLYFLANVSYVVKDSPFSSTILSETYVLRTLTEFGAVAILLAYHLNLTDSNARLRMQAMESAWRAQAEQYRAYEVSIALVNQKYHDLKHQLRLLRQGVDTQEKRSWLDEMERELSSYESQYKTGNATLDTVLTAEGMECAKEGIHLSVVADGEALSGIHPLDLSALLGNLLDNAIECERRIDDPERRLITVSVARRNAYVQICVRNICQEPVTFRNGLPVSTKGDAGFHGFGTASVRQIVEKYQGSLLMRCEDDWFDVSMLLPAASNGG